MLGVTFLRWWSAHTLQKYQLSTVLHSLHSGTTQVHPDGCDSTENEIGGDDDEHQELPSASHGSPLQHHIFLLAEVISMKRRGAAGGHHSRIRGLLSRL